MTSLSLPSPYPEPGEVIDGKYQIEKILGEGGMGCVARAFHVVLRAPVALKFMNPQFMTFPGAVERFINEGIASKRIRSDHVVAVEDVGKLANGAPFLVMPCLDGLDLADVLARDGEPGLAVPRAVHFVVQILRGLQAAHAAGIIHRDMKPSNCFVVKHDGEADFVKILDFGISKVVQPGQSASLTQTNSALGTPLYMSPEQARSPRDVDSRSDLYSCGVILYELLAGHTPFFSESGEFTEILFKLFTADPPSVKTTRPELDDALVEAVHHALTREPEDRFATALEMAEALEPFADDRTRDVLRRMRAFRPEQAVSMPPPADMPLPPSMVAFSGLSTIRGPSGSDPGDKPATDLMPNRPGTEVDEPAVKTALMDSAPGRVAAPSSPEVLPAPGKRPTTDVLPAGEPRPRYVSSPPDEEARARPEEANARTQLRREPAPAVTAAGVSTDLGAAREAMALEASPSPKRSPLVWALPAVVLAAIAGGALAVARGQDDTATADPSTSATTVESAPPPPTATDLPSAAVTAVASAAPSAAPSASASAAPSASASAAPATSAETTPHPKHPRGYPERVPPKTTPTGTTNVLDIGIKQ